MKTNKALATLLVVAMSGVSVADSYGVLLRRYEKQIRQQQHRLQGLESQLQQKEVDAVKWQQKAANAKTLWSQASTAGVQAKHQVEVVQGQLGKTRVQAEAAEWQATQNVLQARANDVQLASLTREIYMRQQVPTLLSTEDISAAWYRTIANRLGTASVTAHSQAQQATQQETVLRSQEMRWQTEAEKRSDELERLHTQEQAEWLRWQEAERRRVALEDEKMQMEQSQQALQVMLKELQDHRDQTLALREGRSAPSSPALASLKGTLPWPVDGRIVQNFGRQYSSDLNQLLVSNGIKIEAANGRTVRSIEPGKVLFASPFRQYGPLIIVQHKNGLTSVYGGLGRTQVKEGDTLAALDSIGTIGPIGSFYFELRCDEQPINPLVYLTPAHTSQLSLRRTFR